MWTLFFSPPEASIKSPAQCNVPGMGTMPTWSWRPSSKGLASHTTPRWRTILTEMEAEGCVDFHINSHTARRPEGSLQAADTPDHFEIAPVAENPLVYKYLALGPGRVVKQSNAANLFTVQQLASGRLEMVWRIAFSSEDLEHSPKKPLWLLKEEQPLATGQCIRLV